MSSAAACDRKLRTSVSSGLGVDASTKMEAAFDYDTKPFRPPPEAPTYRPTLQEFQDPLGYIAKIRHEAQKYGICKIKPPPDWQPPFAVDVDNCKFTPRIQRLNELEAQTRVKLNFLDQIARFWELQGSSLKIPVVDKKALDLYTLHRLVQEEGGAEAVTRDRRWTHVAHRMGFRQSNHKSVGAILKTHYERVVHPYQVFQKQGRNGRSQRPDVDADGVKVEKDAAPLTPKKELDKDYVPHHIPSRMAVKPPPPSKRTRRNRHYNSPPESDPLEKYICHVCARGDAEESMLLCDGCDDSYHTFCLLPPLAEIPMGDWRCPCCVAEEVSKPTEAFGFEQATQEYTLQSFGEMADQFKADFFGMPVHLVPTELVESEFWRIVSSIDEDVVVEYGADLHSMDHGSGFPTVNSRNLLPGDEEYATDGWNLNNLPNLEGSVLGFINADISGMKVPWMYVGMCFSAFCWHNEDHWSYSINYLHWGEPKTWYGVPGDDAEVFETAMKAAAPELFRSQPDLLHQLVTIMNPNKLTDEGGVPVYRLDQHAGEFVITFPRAYHTGFNQGYNFAEAVNFAPADWLEMGRKCVENYSLLHRFCVFSHDELVCKIASSSVHLSLDTAAAACRDMAQMLDHERHVRKQIYDWGVKDAEREAFELLPDDERQCDHCKTTCFLSALTCQCAADRLVCLRHARLLCECPAERHTLRYRYTLDELVDLFHKLRSKVETFNEWTSKLRQALSRTGADRVDLAGLKELLADAVDKRLPDTELVKDLQKAVDLADTCTQVAQQLVSAKVRTRTRLQGEAKCRLTFEELQQFADKLRELPCHIVEAPAIYRLLEQVAEFQGEAKRLLEPAEGQPPSIPQLQALQACLERGAAYGIHLPEIARLKQRMQQAEWMEKYEDLLGTEPVWDPDVQLLPTERRRDADNDDDCDDDGGGGGDVSLDSLRHLLELGVGLPPHPALEKALAKLQGLLDASEKIDDKAADALQSKSKMSLAAAEALVKEVELLPTYLPSVALLQEALRKARDWLTKLAGLHRLDYSPYLEALELLLQRARPIQIQLEPLENLEKQVVAAQAWRERTARTFLRKNSYYTLVEVLSPKLDALAPNRFRKRRLKEDPFQPSHVSHVVALDAERRDDPRAIVEAFKEAEAHELGAFKRLRAANVQKKVIDVQGQSNYCTCQSKAQGNMIECCLCKEWFHTACLPAVKNTPNNNNSSSNNSNNTTSKNSSSKQHGHGAAAAAATNGHAASSGSGNEAPSSAASGGRGVAVAAAAGGPDAGRFLCGFCCRSRRPRLETILSLLVSLQKLPVRLPEGEALQCLTERAMNWQDRARQLLATDAVAACLGQLSVATPAQQQQQQQQSLALTAAAAAARKKSVATLQSCSGEESSQDADDRPVPSAPVFEAQVPALGSSEHAYSTSSQPSQAKKNSRKSPLVPRSLCGTGSGPIGGSASASRLLLVDLPPALLARLEELLTEGDSLEVSLDETTHIGRLLLALRPPSEPPVMALLYAKNERHSNKASEASPASSPSKKKAPKKRRLDAGGGGGPKAAGAKTSASKASASQAKKVKVGGAKKNDAKRRGQPSKDKDADDKCAADKCLKPNGKEVHWVQCDGGCEMWFHLRCVGLTAKDVDQDKDYFCQRCQLNRRRGSGAAAAAAEDDDIDDYIDEDDDIVEDADDL